MTATQTSPRYVVKVRHGRPDDITTGRGGVSHAEVIDTTDGHVVTSFPSTIGVDHYRRLARRFAAARNAA
jgi:hypothetical protein